VNIGELEVHAVSDGSAQIPPASSYASLGATGKGSKDGDWENRQEFLTPDGKLELSMGGFLVRSGDRKVLIDTGIGPTGSSQFGQLLSSLEALGLSPSDITDVVLTHLHFDHIGWVSQEGEPTFPNATYRCDKRDWEHFVGKDDTATTKMTPVKERFEAFDGDVTIAPGIDTRLATGHTPGSSIIVLSSGTKRALLVGDVVHCPIELVDDEWDGMGDVDPEMARRTRNALARELEGADVSIAAAHFPGLQFGRLLTGEGRRNWVFG